MGGFEIINKFTLKVLHFKSTLFHPFINVSVLLTKVFIDKSGRVLKEKTKKKVAECIAIEITTFGYWKLVE